jgi:uncharacterized membrane protein
MATSTPTLPQLQPSQIAASARQEDRPVNVGDQERWLSLLGGGLLALYLVRRSLGTVLLVGGAGALLYRGWTGHCGLYQNMGLSTVAPNVPSDNSRSITVPDEPPRVVLAES